MTFVIAELKPGETGGYAPRGAVKKLWQTRDFETIVSGPAETGKTWGCLQYADALLWKYPGAQGVMARETYASLVPSALQTYLRIIGPNSPIRTYGGEKPQWFQYPNGSRFWVAGLDNPGKALSSERDFIYVNQAEQISLEDWETLTTRCTGRGAVMPYTRMFGDCNPDAPLHWIRQKPGLRLLESRHEDNPTLFDDDGNLTPQGRITIGILDSLSGVRHLRLRLGKWAAAEGQIYEAFDEAVHVISRAEVPAGCWHLWTVDFGFTNPFVWQDWAVDGDGRMYLVKEIYFTERLVEDHAKQIEKESPGIAPQIFVCDHDAEDRATLEKHLKMRTTGAYKAVSPGIQAVQSRLKRAGDGKPRLFICRDALVETDQKLKARHKPTCTREELPGYVWNPAKDAPVKADDHGQDAKRYGVAQIDKIWLVNTETTVSAAAADALGL